ncbi:MAG TPA: transglutaminase domain-containing protein [Rugosibacter sp.]
MRLKAELGLLAHLMIALCRILNIPARFVPGIDYGVAPAMDPTDFHAYVEVFLGNRWYLFDPTGVSSLMGLVRLVPDVMRPMWHFRPCWAPFPLVLR